MLIGLSDRGASFCYLPSPLILLPSSGLGTSDGYLPGGQTFLSVLPVSIVCRGNVLPCVPRLEAGYYSLFNSEKRPITTNAIAMVIIYIDKFLDGVAQIV